MPSARRLYRRFNEWTRSLSRASYAVLVGGASGVTFLVVSAALGDPMIAGAVAFGVTMVLLQYAFDRRDTDG